MSAVDAQLSEAAPRTVLALVADLFFSVKLTKELRAHGFAPRIVRSADEFLRLVAAERPALGIIDLATGVDWDRIAALGAEAPDVPLLVFGPHKDVEGFQAAKAAGVTRVVSNSLFHRQAPELVARYARP
jgi:ActR/RegA family two-component response regulator